MEILFMQIQFAIAVLLVLVLRQFMKKLPKIYTYILWMIAFTRLFIPFNIQAPVAMMPSQPSFHTQDIISIPILHNADSGMKESTSTENAQGQAEITDRKMFTEKQDYHTVYHFMAILVWMIGTVSIFAVNTKALIRLAEKIYDAKQIGENEYVSKHVNTAFTLGLFKMRIYLPISLKEHEKQYIVCHEKVHIRRKDYFVKNIAFLLTALNWFNPFVWIAFHYLELDMEMACDEAVIQELGISIKKQYSQSLLDVSIGQKSRAYTPLAFGEVNVKRRVKNVLTKKKQNRIVGSIGVAVIALTTVCMFTTKANSNKEVSAANINVSSERQEQLEQRIQAWASAFSNRDVNYIMSHTSKDAQESMMQSGVLYQEDGEYAFGYSSPWPWGDEESCDVKIVELDENKASILYYARTSEPSVTVWKEEITFGVNDQVAMETLKFYDDISKIEEYEAAYPNGIITGTEMDYVANGLGEALNNNALSKNSGEYYKDLLCPDTAARKLLFLAENEKVKITVGEKTKDGTIVTITFVEDGGQVNVLMIQPYGPEGIWIVQNIEK